MGRSTVRSLVAVIAVLTLVWVAMVAYVGVQFLSVFRIGFSSCLPDDFPTYPHAAISSIVISDVHGDCTVQYQVRGSSDEVKTFFKSSLDEGDWVVTGVADQAGQIRFTRHSNPNVRGYVQVLGFPGLTQYQVQLRGG